MMMFKIERRALVAPLKLKCGDCEGLGKLIYEVSRSCKSYKTCPTCGGKRYIEGD